MDFKPPEVDNQSRGNNSVYPFSKESPMSQFKDEAESLIKYPQTFQISQEVLINLVRDAENRKFCEEVDKLEYLGGYFFFFLLFFNVFFNFFFLGEAFLEKGLNSNFSSGISTNPEEMLQREEEYGHNRKEPRIPDSNFLKKQHNILIILLFRFFNAFMECITRFHVKNFAFLLCFGHNS